MTKRILTSEKLTTQNVSHFCSRNDWNGESFVQQLQSIIHLVFSAPLIFNYVERFSLLKSLAVFKTHFQSTNKYNYRSCAVVLNKHFSPAVVPPLICPEDRLTAGSHQADGGPLRLERWPYNIAGIPRGEGRGWQELFPPKVKHGNDYVHCCWLSLSWVVSLSLSLSGWNEHTM